MCQLAYCVVVCSIGYVEWATRFTVYVIIIRRKSRCTVHTLHTKQRIIINKTSELKRDVLFDAGRRIRDNVNKLIYTVRGSRI